MAEPKERTPKKVQPSVDDHEPAVDAKSSRTAPAHAPAVAKPRRKWNIAALFWGLLLISVGTLLLLGNFGVLDVEWAELWRLWPLLVIGGGFSVLASTHWAWKVLSLLFILITIILIGIVGSGAFNANDSGQVKRQETSAQLSRGVERGEVEIAAGASELRVASKDVDKIVSAVLESINLTLNQDATTDGSTQRVRLSTESNRTWWLSPSKNKWDVTLTERLPLALTIDSGASSINADLSHVQLSTLTLKAGASSIDLKLGSKASTMKVNIDSGASAITIKLPKSSGVSLKFDGALSSTDVDNLKQVAEGEYRSEDYDTAENKIDIVADAGLAAFTINRY